MIVEWDDEKAFGNERKHGVSFQEALAVIEDPLSITFRDPDHSLEEARFLTFAMGLPGVSLWAHTDRGDAVRLVSARRATRAERQVYEEG